MKKFFIVLMIIAFAMTSFAQADKKTVRKKPSIAVQKKLQFYKLMAGEEKAILEKYIECLNTVDTLEGIKVCNNKKREMFTKLRRAIIPKNKQKAQRRAMPQQPKPEKK